MTNYVTHLESAIDGTRLEADRLQTMHAGRPLWVRYDLDSVRDSLTKERLQHQEPTMWRYRELLPADSEAAIVSLGEGMTPMLRCRRLGERLRLSDLWIKDESQLPTGSFKSRGQAVAITMAKRFGVRRVAIPTAGNAGGAMAAYAARAGMEAFVFMPADAPSINQFEAQAAGAKVFLVDGLITDCGAIVRAGIEPMGWFDISTLKEPYRIEGKKTMGLEIAEQFDWKLPDVIVYPTGGGTGLIGMWKAFNELAAMDWLESPTMPRMVAVQSSGCCPIVRAFDKQERFAEPFPEAQTIASGIRVPVAVGDFMILDAIRESNGTAVSVDDNKIIDWMSRATAAEGISICPESAACVAAVESLVASDWIKPDERVVVLNCAAIQKYSNLAETPPPLVENTADPDWDWIARGGV
jgi:threonine synthase